MHSRELKLIHFSRVSGNRVEPGYILCRIEFRVNGLKLRFICILPVIVFLDLQWVCYVCYFQISIFGYNPISIEH